MFINLVIFTQKINKIENARKENQSINQDVKWYIWKQRKPEIEND
jgi:hypothetical protein